MAPFRSARAFKRTRILALLLILSATLAKNNPIGRTRNSKLVASASTSATLDLPSGSPRRGWFHVPQWMRGNDNAKTANLEEMESGVGEILSELAGKQIVLEETNEMAQETAVCTIKEAVPEQIAKDQFSAEDEGILSTVKQKARRAWQRRPRSNFDNFTWKATVTIPVRSVKVNVITSENLDESEEVEGNLAYAVVDPDSTTIVTTDEARTAAVSSTEDSPANEEDQEGQLTLEQPVSRRRTFFHFRRAKPEEEKVEDTGPIDYTKSPYAFTLYQKGDGSETDPDGLPLRYINMQRGNREISKICLEKTIKWRAENDIDTILARPQPKFDKCKAVFPHYFCGRDDTGHVILLQKPGSIDLELAEKNGLTGEDLLFGYVYIMEYLWQIIEPRPNETMTSIIDMEGVSFSVLSKRELINVVQMFCRVMDAHFPQRSYKTFMINCPRWFNTLYKFISPLLRENTKKKIFIFAKGPEQDEALRSIMTDRELAPNTDPMTLLQPAEMENELREFVLARLKESDETMAEVVR